MDILCLRYGDDKVEKHDILQHVIDLYNKGCDINALDENHRWTL